MIDVAFMERGFLTAIPTTLRPFLGQQDGETNIFKAEGSQEQMSAWFEAICDHGIHVLSPGGVAAYVGASRAGVHNRLKAGGLTAFCFTITGKTKTLFGGEKKLRELALVYVPVEEAKAWKRELAIRAKRIEARKQWTEEDRKFVEELTAPTSKKGGDIDFLERPAQASKAEKRKR